MCSLYISDFVNHQLCLECTHSHNVIILHSHALLFSTVYIDCITVSTLPVKSTIDDHIQQLFDALLSALRRAISSHFQVYSTTYIHKLNLLVIRTSEFSLEFSEDVGVGEIWEELLTTSKLLCSTYLNIKGICSLKALKFKRLKYTRKNTAM